MNDNLDKPQMIEQEESTIDFSKILYDMLKYKRIYYKILPLTLFVAAFFSLSIPNYYDCMVKLSPEMSGSAQNSSLASLASSFGINLGKTGGGIGTEALFPTLYPELMNSTDFMISLFTVPVTIEGDKEKGESDCTMNYYDYLEYGQKYPWWSFSRFTTYISKLISKEEDDSQPLNSFRLTKKQFEIVKILKEKIICEVDKKTMVITIKVTDQDPVISATIADTVKNRLQNFITDYRTSKARVDLEYNQKLFKEAKERYEKARQKYAEFMDANHDIILHTVRQKQTDLENEMQLQYNAYTTVASNLYAAEAKVQEDTPAFTTIQSATVPVKKAGPKRILFCITFLILAFLVVSVYGIYKEGDLKSLLGLK